MIKRIKEIFQSKKIEQSKDLVDDTYYGKGIFFDEGFSQEAEELKKQDEGTLPWYKRMFRNE